MHPSSILVALLAAAQLSGGLSFAVVARSTSLQSFSASTSHASHVAATPLRSSRVRRTTTTATHAARDLAIATALPHRARRRSRLGAAEGASDGEENAQASENPSAAAGTEALVNSVGGVTAPAGKADVAVGGGGAAGTGVDLSKGIAFEAPKPKAAVAEEEEESASKKVRAVLLADKLYWRNGSFVYSYIHTARLTAKLLKMVTVIATVRL